MATAGGQVATWTVLFTDMVASTERRVRVGEDLFDRVRADLDKRVDRAVEAHDGVAVKSTGDGIMAGFAATASALRCAAAIQTAVRDRNRETGDDVALRIGVSVGDAVVEDGDIQGTAVVEAARLCAVAEPGTILCSGAVRAVSANRSGCAFGEANSVELKGLPGPVIVYEVILDASVDRPDGHALTFRVLGPVEVERDGRVVAVGGPKERLVLAVLLASAGTTISLDALADAIWGERPPRTAERTVHAYIARLRRALEPRRRSGESPAVIETVGRGYRLRIDPDQLDAGRFEQLARSGAEQLDRDPTAAGAALRAALAEWRGRAYTGLDDVGLCAAEAARLNALRLGAIEDRVDADLAVGRAADLVPELEAAVEDQPFRERLWGQLMVALYRSARQRDALEAFQRARRTLVDELGIEPGPELRRLEAAVLDQDPALDERRPLPRSSGSAGLPLALAAVGSAFVGRDRELTWLRSAWADADDGRGGFVSILGPEGAGKTRLVAEVAREAHGNRAVVLYGRCDHAHRGARALVHQAFGSADGSIGEIDHAADVTDLATAVVRHLSAWADGRTVMLVLDDLHLSDAEALEFVADLAGWCQATRLLVVGIFRTDGPVLAPPGGDSPTSDESRLALGPLGYDDVAGICQLYEPDGWNAEDVRRVADLSDGLPLLVHEQASAFAEARAARRVEQAAGRLAASRGRLLTSRGEVADGVETIQQLLEQRRAQLAGREAQLQAEGVSALAGCPYKGLARFEAADADNFFGRERLVAELLARVSETSLVAVVGPSGSGKSSLLRAGLLPALATGVLAGGDPWRTVALCPGARPTEELAARLRDLPSTGAPRAVLVDQFEETFTLGASPDEQVQFIDRLLALSREPATCVVLAVRADHLGRCAAHPDLAAQLAGNDVLVGPMRDSELRRSVELPAQRAGLEIEAGVVEVIVGDVAGRAGALPLLSTALAETWERREGRRLTLAGYRAAGRVNGALARLAEDGYGAIPAPARPAARRILLRLCDVGEDAALDVRRRLPLPDVVDENDHDGRVALDALADRRLLTVHGDTVEVAHESLLREWPRLRGWLEEDIEGRRLHRRLGDAARAWDDDGRDPSELYRGTQLHAAGDWAQGHSDTLNRLERDFLDASEAQADSESRATAERARRDARQNRRLRALVVGTAGALILALVGGAVAFGQREQANEERERAEQESRVATARELAAAANANLDVDPERSILLALAAVDRSRSGDASVLPEAEQALHDAVTASRAVLHVSGVGDAVAWSPDGTQFAAADPDGAVIIHDAATGEPVQTIAGHDEPVNGIAFSPDGALLGTTGEDGYTKVWDLETGGELHALDSPLGRDTLAPSFSRDGTLFAASWWNEAFVRIMDPATGRIVREIAGFPACCPRSTAFDPSGTRMALALADNTAVVVDVRSGQQVLDLGVTGASDAAWSPDGTSIAVAQSDGSARIVDARTGQERFALVGHRGRVNAVDWSPDSTQVVTASEDGTAKLWRVSEAGGRQLFTLSAQATRAGVSSAAFSPDGSRVVTGDVESRGTIIWDVSIAGDAELANVPAAASGGGKTAAFSPDGRYLLAGNAAGGVSVWDAQTFTGVRTLGAPAAPSSEPPGSGEITNPPATTGSEVTALAVSPDGRLVAAASSDWTVCCPNPSSLRIWDVETGQEAFRTRPRGYVDDVAWSPDGKLLAISATRFTAGADGNPTAMYGSLAIVDRSGDEVAYLPDDEQGVQLLSLAFTPDGEGLIAARSHGASWEGYVGEAVVWDWKSGELEHRLETGDDFAVLSPRGDLLVSTPRNFLTGSQVANVWDWATRQHLRRLSHSGSVTSAAFSPDGSRLATASRDGTIRVWDPYADAPERLVLRGHAGPVGVIAFSPDGSRLASASDDGTVSVWALDLDELVDIAERGLTRSLTDDECLQYLHTERCPDRS